MTDKNIWRLQLQKSCLVVITTVPWLFFYITQSYIITYTVDIFLFVTVLLLLLIGCSGDWKEYLEVSAES